MPFLWFLCEISVSCGLLFCHSTPTFAPIFRNYLCAKLCHVWSTPVSWARITLLDIYLLLCTFMFLGTFSRVWCPLPRTLMCMCIPLCVNHCTTSLPLGVSACVSPIGSTLLVGVGRNLGWNKKRNYKSMPFFEVWLPGENRVKYLRHGQILRKNKSGFKFLVLYNQDLIPNNSPLPLPLQ